MKRDPTPFAPLVRPGGIALSDSEKPEALADNLEAHFQPMTDSSVPAFIETVEVALRSFSLSPASEFQLTTPDDVHEAIRSLKFSKAPGSNGIPKMALRTIPIEWFPSSPVSSTRFSAPIAFLKRGSMLV